MDTDDHTHAVLRRATTLFIALSDPVRQDIYRLLASCGALSVNEITVQTDLARPTVSHHLKLLVRAGLLRSEKRGVRRFYQATSASPAQQLRDVATALEERE